MAESAKIGSIFAEIRARLDKYDKDLKDARKMSESALSDIQGKVDKLSFQKAGNQFIDFAKKAAAAFAAFKMVDFVKDATMAAARYETLGIVLDRLSQNTNYTTSEIKGFEEAMRKTGIAGIETRQIMAMMIQSNIDLSKSTDLARVAQDAAVLANLNSSETMQRMMHAIQANSVEIIRTIGLNVSFEAATQKLAKSLGKTTTELTEAEKVQARMNAVIEAGTLIAGAYESAMTTAQKQLRSFERYVQDFEVEFGKAFNPALTAIVFGASEALKTLTETVKDPQFQRDMTKFADEFAKNLVDGMKWIVENKEQVTGYFTGVASGLKTIASVMSSLPMEAWGAILGFAVGGPIGAAGGAAAAGIIRLTEPDRRSLIEFVQGQVEAQEKQIELLKQQGNIVTGELGPKEQALLKFLESQLEARREGLALLVKQANLVHMLKDETERIPYDYGRAKINPPAGFTPPPVEPLTKEAEATVKKFWEDYNKELYGEFEFERVKLAEQLKVYDKFVTDKLALSQWYAAEKRKIDIKEFASMQSLDVGSMAAETRYSKTMTLSNENAQKFNVTIEEQRQKIYALDEAANQERWFETYVGGIEDAARANEIFNDTMNIMSQNMADAVAEFALGTKSISSAINEMVQSIFAAMMRLSTQKTFEMLFGKLMQVGGQFAGTYFGGETPTGMGAGAGVPWGPKTGDWAAMMHNGGIVDGNSPRRRVPAWLFNSAPRLHEGLAADEFPAILQKGEEVKSRKDAGKDVPAVHLHFYPNASGQYDRESVSEAQSRLYAAIQRANQRNR